MWLPSPTPPANIANTAPRNAIPSVAPIMRAVLTRPDAVPERAAGTLATATAFTGPVLRPRPQPITSIAASTKKDAVVQRDQRQHEQAGFHHRHAGGHRPPRSSCTAVK
jgi:hypothetical protein